MKRAVIAALIVMLCPLTAGAIVPSFGAGVFFGREFPIAQDDQAAGSTYGFRGIVKAIPNITLEPHLTFVKYGDPTVEGVTSDLKGSKINGYGINALIGSAVGAPGLNWFFVGGIGTYKIKRDQTAVFQKESSDFGWSFGTGFGFGLTPMLGIDARGQLIIIPSEGGGSKKAAAFTGGVTYYFGGK